MLKHKYCTCITRYDYTRLLDMIRKFYPDDEKHIPVKIKALIKDLKKAKKVNPEDIPPNYVTINSVFKLKDLGSAHSIECQLVLPNDADIDSGKLSILTSPGIDILGNKVGDIIRWEISSGEKYFQISQVVQPGRF